jgi:hypothetical protein
MPAAELTDLVTDSLAEDRQGPLGRYIAALRVDRYAPVPEGHGAALSLLGVACRIHDRVAEPWLNRQSQPRPVSISRLNMHSMRPVRELAHDINPFSSQNCSGTLQALITRLE